MEISMDFYMGLLVFYTQIVGDYFRLKESILNGCSNTKGIKRKMTRK